MFKIVYEIYQVSIALQQTTPSFVVQRATIILLFSFIILGLPCLARTPCLVSDAVADVTDQSWCKGCPLTYLVSGLGRLKYWGSSRSLLISIWPHNIAVIDSQTSYMAAHISKGTCAASMPDGSWIPLYHLAFKLHSLLSLLLRAITEFCPGSRI